MTRQKQQTVYIYLARRDRNSVRIISKLGQGQCLATRLNNIKQLSLEFRHEVAIAQIAEKDKMDWELWIESAPSFQELKRQLAKRGYTGLPMNDKPTLDKELHVSQDDLQKLPNQQIMMRRKSQST